MNEPLDLESGDRAKMPPAPAPPSEPATALTRSAHKLWASPLWRRAVGEFLLIVSGVLVALWVNNWNTARDRDRTAAALLRSVGRAIAGDLALLRAADSGYRARESRMQALVDHLRAGRAYADSLESSFGAVFGLWSVALNRAPYEALKASDLSLISSDSLRGALAELYERTYADLAAAEQTDQNAIFEVMRPYYLRAFRDLKFRESATPLDPQAVLRDPYFQNLVEYRLAVLRANQLTTTAAAIPEVAATLRLVNAELARLQ